MLLLFFIYDNISKFGDSMKIINISKSLKVSTYDENDYISFNKEINNDLNKILAYYGFEEEKEYLENLNGDIFLKHKRIFIYVLFEDKEPISFAIFEKTKKNKVSLQFICTKLEYTKLGFATMLLRASACNLKDNQIDEFVVKNIDDLILKNLLNSFAKVDGVIFEENEKFYNFDIKNIKNEQILSEIKQFYI